MHDCLKTHIGIKDASTDVNMGELVSYSNLVPCHAIVYICTDDTVQNNNSGGNNYCNKKQCQFQEKQLAKR